MYVTNSVCELCDRDALVPWLCSHVGEDSTAGGGRWPQMSGFPAVLQSGTSGGIRRCQPGAMEIMTL